MNFTIVLGNRGSYRKGLKMKIEHIEKELNNRKQITENGMVGYSTSGNKLLDMNYKISSYRYDCQEAVDDFLDVLKECRTMDDVILAFKWLFYLRDVRGGAGERDSFRAIVKKMSEMGSYYVHAFLELIPEYGRYDDWFCLLDLDEDSKGSSIKSHVLYLIRKTILSDLDAIQKNEPISLLGKWLPNTTNKRAKRLAKIIYKGIGISRKEYREVKTKLNAYLKTVECDMSAQRWNEIDYTAVPSKANIIYRNAFLRHDEERRREFLNEVSKGKVSINGSVNFPHDILHQYNINRNGSDETCELLWKALPDYVNGDSSTIVVADGSGSMRVPVGNSGVTALTVANSLAIYFAERAKGEYKDKYITFSCWPQLVDFSSANSLYEKNRIALKHCEMSNTNIKAVFDLILQVAVNNNYEQKDLPGRILIISDMEFDSCASMGGSGWYCSSTKGELATGFDQIASEYSAKGYKLPRLVFWNVNSRTNTIPVRENEFGVALVSGFSPSAVKMVLSDEADPYKCLVDMLNTERYERVEDALLHNEIRNEWDV